MARKPKTHLLRSLGEFAIATSACGMVAVENHTTDRDAVTCAMCLDEIRAQAPAPAMPLVIDLAVGERVGTRVALEIRREISDGIRWKHWSQPVREYFQDVDEAAPLRSTSDPSRFQGMTPSGTAAEGDRAQRRRAELAFVSKDLDAAFTQPFVLNEFPRRAFTAETCKHIIELCVAGAPRAGNIGRRDIEKADLASRLTAMCNFVVSVQDVDAVIMFGGARLEDAFVNRGVLITRDRRLRRVA